LASATGERDDLFALVSVECVLPRGDRLVTAAGRLEHLGEIAVGVGLKLG
jgi:hypothetical protein